MDTYEKKYNEAIVRAKAMIKVAANQDEAIGFANTVFPELAESKDERIRKEMLNVFKQLDEGTTICGRNYDYAKWIAWLEKQGVTSDQIHYWTEEEIEPIISDYLRGAEHYGGMIARLRCLKPKSLEKQGEQKVSVVDFKARDWYVSKVDGKIYNAKFMEKNPTNQARKLEIEKAAMSATGIIEQEEWFIKGAEWSDKNPSYISSEKHKNMDKSVKVKGFVAVDNCGDKTIINPTGRRVVLFPKKPVRDLLTNNHYWAAHISPYDVIHLGYEDFPELKWEDEPIEVEIIINKD